MLQDSIQRFVHDQYAFEQRMSSIANWTEPNSSKWQAFAELGWLMMPFDENCGGLSGSAVDLMVIMKEFGKAMVVEPFVSATVLSGRLLSQTLEFNDIASELVEKTIHGSCKVGLAYTEVGERYDVRKIGTRLSVQNGKMILNGKKHVVLNGDQSDKLIVTAVNESGELRLVCVDANVDGMSKHGYLTVDGFTAADIVFDDVIVQETDLLCPASKSVTFLQSAIDFATFATCAEAVGIMQAVLDKTVEYTKTRKQFGKPLSSFQALQHRMADMFTELQMAESILISAAIELDTSSLNAPQAVSAAKSLIGHTCRLIGQESVQLHGGMGITEELDIGHYFKRLTIIQSMYGSTDFHTQRYSRLKN